MFPIMLSPSWSKKLHYLPPDMTVLALVNSGRSLLLNSWPTNWLRSFLASQAGAEKELDIWNLADIQVYTSALMWKSYHKVLVNPKNVPAWSFQFLMYLIVTLVIVQFHLENSQETIESSFLLPLSYHSMCTYITTIITSRFFKIWDPVHLFKSCPW